MCAKVSIDATHHELVATQNRLQRLRSDDADDRLQQLRSDVLDQAAAQQAVQAVERHSYVIAGGPREGVHTLTAQQFADGDYSSIGQLVHDGVVMCAKLPINSTGGELVAAQDRLQSQRSETERQRRAECDAAEERSREQFDRQERLRYQQEQDDLQHLNKNWHRLWRNDSEEAIHWLEKRVSELPPAKRQRLMQHLS